MSEVEILPVVRELSLKEKALSELSAVEVGIADLRRRFGGLTLEVGMDVLKLARAEVREVRYKVPKIVTDISRQLNDLKKDVQRKGDEVEIALHRIEDPIHNIIKAEEERKERIKAEEAAREETRRQAILDRIDRIKALPVAAVSLSASDTMAMIEHARAIPLLAEEMQEFLSKAQSVKAETINKLIEMHTAKVQQEGEAARLAEERERQEAERKEREAEELIERAKREKEQKDAAAKLAEERRQFQEFQTQQKAEAEAKEAARQEAWKEAEAQRVAEQKRLDAEKAEISRLKIELAAKEEAERIRQEDEAAKIEAAERQKAEEEATKEQARQAKANEKAADLANKLKDPIEALKAIHALCVDSPVKTAVIVRIEAIAKKFTEAPCQVGLKLS